MQPLQVNFDRQSYVFLFEVKIVDEFERYTVYVDDPRLVDNSDRFYVFLKRRLWPEAGFLAEVKFVFKNVRLQWAIRQALEAQTSVFNNFPQQTNLCGKAPISPP